MKVKEWYISTFKVDYCKPILLYLAKLPFKIYGDIITFQDKYVKVIYDNKVSTAEKFLKGILSN